MFSHLRISYKLLTMAVLALAAVLTIALLGLHALRANLLADREAKLRDVVQLAAQTMTREYQDAIGAGITGQDATLRIRSALRGLRYGNDDYFFAYDKAGVSTVLPDPKTEGQKRWDLKDSDGVLFVRDLIQGAAKGGTFVAYRYPRAGGSEPVPKLAYAVEFKPNGWIIGSGIYIDDMDAIFRSQVLRMAELGGATLLLMTGLCFLLARAITQPINRLTAAMRDLAGGSLATEIQGTQRSDEVGEMARAVVVFKDNAVAVLQLQAEQDAARQRSETEKRAALSDMADKIETQTGVALEHIRARTTAMTTTADAMSASAARTGVAAETAATAAGHALANA